MDNQTICGLMEVARDEANRLIASGIPKQQAVEIVVRALGDVVQNHESGLGQAPLTFLEPSAPATDFAPESVKAVQALISPWLWIFSVVGFGLALLNTKRISKIYGGWSAGRKAIKQGRIPA